MGRPLPGRRCEVIAPSVPSLTSGTPGWQLFVRNAFKGFSEGHCSMAKRSPLKRASSTLPSSDTEEGQEVGTCSREGVSGVPEQLSDCLTDMVLPRQKSSPRDLLGKNSAVLEQVGTCSAAGEVPQRRSGVTPSAGGFGVPDQLSVSTTDLGVPGQTCSGGVMFDNVSAAFEQVGTCSARELGIVIQRTAYASL
eukprot:5339969-Amphidinium_carterae.2